MATTKTKVNVKFVNNEQYGSTEVYFSEKPDTKYTQALKTIKFRWNHVKGCWYGFCTKDEVKSILDKPETAEKLAASKLKERQAYWAEQKAQKAQAKADAEKAETKKAEPKKTQSKKAETKKSAPKAEKAPTKKTDLSDGSFADVYKSTKKCSLTKAGKAAVSKSKK